MNWKLKAHLLAAISRAPLGNTLYHYLQRLGGTNKIAAERDVNRALELVDLSLAAGQQIAGSVCFEVGTGWRPFVPFVLTLGGAKEVITVDVNPWLTEEYVLETWRAIKGFLGEIAAHCGVSEADVIARYQAVEVGSATMQNLFSQLNITYQYPGDARDTKLPEDSVDLIVSSNVLEHIPASIQVEIHQESFRILKAGGLAVHRFNPQDHYATVDASISHINFLQFSEQQWEWYGGGLSYHNRLRAPVYRDLFLQCGFEIEVCRERVDARSVEAINSGSLNVHPDFEGYTPEELSVDYMWMACRKPDSVKAPTIQQSVNIQQR